MDSIVIKDLEHGYGPEKVIRGLNMTVSAGGIYGLLGPSGCGKTTLLKVILGRLVPQRGTVRVLGSTPGEPGSPVPGSAVGYSPQEIALYEDLSIHETLLFHSRLQRMSRADLKERADHFLRFLDLPDKSAIVRRLSGGERRRVSLAVALLHDPDLLLLDEPTVGLDPELRARIWHYMQGLTKEGKTIVITTHYIEEARNSDRVGMMRHGNLLAEDAPGTLIEHYGLETLEDVFLRLCRRESRGEEG